MVEASQMPNLLPPALPPVGILAPKGQPRSVEALEVRFRFTFGDTPGLTFQIEGQRWSSLTY